MVNLPISLPSTFTLNVIKILFLSAFASIFAILWTPILTRFLYKYKLWKKEARKKTITGENAEVFYSLHKEREKTVPRFGGLLIWVTTLITIYFFFFISKFTDNIILKNFNFLSRKETWLPLFALVTGSLVGFFDDLLQVFNKGRYIGGGMSFKTRFLIVLLIGLIGASWFYFKLGWDTIHIPFLGDFFIGILYIPLFIVVMLSCWAGGVIDGLDGLAGGVFASIFGAFSVIAFSQGKIDLSAFCGVIAGTLLAFLWFNIPPARFYMGETGVLGITSTLCVVTFLTNSVFILPIIGGLLVVEVASILVQLFSKKIRKKKIFLSTPIHQHLEAKGWPHYKITMRFWILGIVLAIIGVVISLLG